MRGMSPRGQLSLNCGAAGIRGYGKANSENSPILQPNAFNGVYNCGQFFCPYIGVNGGILTNIPQSIDGTYLLKISITSWVQGSNEITVLILVRSGVITVAVATWFSTFQAPTSLPYFSTVGFIGGRLIIHGMPNNGTLNAVITGQLGSLTNAAPGVLSPAGPAVFDGWSVWPAPQATITGAVNFTWNNGIYGGANIIGPLAGTTTGAFSGLLSANLGLAASGAASSFASAASPQLLQVNSYEVTGLLAQQLARRYC